MFTPQFKHGQRVKTRDGFYDEADLRINDYYTNNDVISYSLMVKQPNGEWFWLGSKTSGELEAVT